MTLPTWLGFLIGRADCIERAAKSRGTLTLGLLFVLSAGLAREYDQEDLLHEPWHALLPLIVSLVTSFLLYCLIQLFTSPPPGETRQFWLGYRSFLGIYWLMAPMAWLYAFPVERLMEDLAAVQFNLWLLSIVSLWRVALMIRVIQVLWNTTVLAVVPLVACFSLTIALLALLTSPTPILSIMGGLRQTTAEHFLAEISFWLRVLFVLSWPIALLAVIGTWFCSRRFTRPLWLPKAHAPTQPFGIAGVVVTLSFLACLPFTQPEQLRRHHAELLLRNGRIEEGLDYIAALGNDKFPPYWVPPPRTGYYGRQTPEIAEVIQVILRKPQPSWLTDIYRRHLMNAMGNEGHPAERRQEYARLALQFPDAEEDIAKYRFQLEWPVQRLPEGSPERERMKAILDYMRSNSAPTGTAAPARLNGPASVE